MAYWQIALILLAAVWALQGVGTWWQMSHYRQVMGAISAKWNDGYVGAGNARGRLGRGVIVLLVVTPDLVVRKLLVMEGRSVFARFQALEEFEGADLGRLQGGDVFPAAEKGRNAALAMAVAQIEKVRRDRLPKGDAEPSTA